MNLIDKNFRENKLRFLAQSALATVAVFLVLLLVRPLTNAAIIAALGASSFVAFTMPHRPISRPRHLLGGYLVGIACGVGAHYIETIPLIADIEIVTRHQEVLFGAMAVGAAFFVMVVTDTEHSPACGVALGLVLLEDSFRIWVVAVILAGILCLVILKALLKKVLIDLI